MWYDQSHKEKFNAETKKKTIICFVLGTVIFRTRLSPKMGQSELYLECVCGDFADTLEIGSWISHF